MHKQITKQEFLELAALIAAVNEMHDAGYQFNEEESKFLYEVCEFGENSGYIGGDIDEELKQYALSRIKEIVGATNC